MSRQLEDVLGLLLDDECRDKTGPEEGDHRPAPEWPPSGRLPREEPRPSRTPSGGPAPARDPPFGALTDQQGDAGRAPGLRADDPLPPPLLPSSAQRSVAYATASAQGSEERVGCDRHRKPRCGASGDRVPSGHAHGRARFLRSPEDRTRSNDADTTTRARTPRDGEGAWRRAFHHDQVPPRRPCSCRRGRRRSRRRSAGPRRRPQWHRRPVPPRVKPRRIRGSAGAWLCRAEPDQWPSPAMPGNCPSRTAAKRQSTAMALSAEMTAPTLINPGRLTRRQSPGQVWAGSSKARGRDQR